MFSQACVILSKGGGRVSLVPFPCPFQGVGISGLMSFPGGRYLWSHVPWGGGGEGNPVSRGGYIPYPPPTEPQKRAVRILPKCFLVAKINVPE